MKKLLLCPILLILSASIFFVSCMKETQYTASNHEELLSVQNNKSRGAVNRIDVNDVAQLYEAINNPENEESTIVLAPGTYLLSPEYPKGGRLELAYNMSLRGQPGQPGKVVIDVTGLPLSSFTIAPSNSRTGAIRMGNGNNTIEWLTFQNDPAHTIRSLIQTDITATNTTHIRVAHCIIKGSSIGISILNRDPVANGRVLEAEITGNEIMYNTVPQFGSGIQVQNTLVENAVLRVKLSQNHIHDNKSGMLIFNSSSQNCVLEINSYKDKIENNGIGMVLNGGFVLNTTSPTLGNKLVFGAFASSISNNKGLPAPPFAFPAVGVHAAGGQAMPPFDLPGTAHDNQLEASFHGCVIENNGGSYQLNAYGGHSFHPSLTPVGTNNTNSIYLYGVSKNTEVNSLNSLPAEPAGTNTVNVYR